MMRSIKNCLPESDEPSFEIITPERVSLYGNQPEDQKALIERYIYQTDKLVQIICGSQEDGSGAYDGVVFLDKSARPVSWMIRELWPYLAPRRLVDGYQKLADRPAMKYINIDRLHWRQNPDVPRRSEQDDKPIAEEDLDGIRAIFAKRTPDLAKGETWQTVPSWLDGLDRILIVDETMESGDTMYYAGRLLSRAFPNKHWGQEYWESSLGSTVTPSGDRNVVRRPAWYHETSQTGRGVFDPDPQRIMNYARKNPRNLPNASFSFLSTVPMIKRSLSSTDKERIAQLVSIVLDPQTTPQQQSDSLEQIDSIEYTRKDEQAAQLLREMGRIAVMLSKLEVLAIMRPTDFESGLIIPPNVLDPGTGKKVTPEKYRELLRQRVKRREMAKKK